MPICHGWGLPVNINDMHINILPVPTRNQEWHVYVAPKSKIKNRISSIDQKYRLNIVPNFMTIGLEMKEEP